MLKDHFWQHDRSSVENSATFRTQTCVGCHRTKHPEMVPFARPICIMPSYDEGEIVEHIAEGHPYVDTLPEWDPVGCSELFPTTDPIVRFKMDDNEANAIVHDARDIYPQTFLSPGGNPNTNTHSVAGHIGTALGFNGVRDSIELASSCYSSVLAAATNFTMCMWINYTTALGAAYKGWIGNSSLTVDGMEILENKSSLSWSFRFTSGGSTWSTGFTISPIATNTWKFIGTVRSGTTFRHYKDATYVPGSTNAKNANTLCPSNQPFRFARGWNNSTYRQVKVDDFRLYNYALTTSDMLSIYNGTL